MGWSAGAWAYRPGPLRTSAAGAPLAAGAFTTGQAATPGRHGAALRGPGGRPPRAGSHRGMTLYPSGRLAWWTSVAGIARAGDKAHARAWRDWRGLACSVVATRPHAPRRSLRSGVVRLVFYCRAVCRAGTRSGRVLPPLSARPDAGVNAAVAGPWQR